MRDLAQDLLARQAAEEPHTRRDPEPLCLCPQVVLLFAGAGEVERQARAAPRQAAERLDREVEPLLVLEPTGGEQVAGRWPRCGVARRLDRIRNYLHPVEVELRDGCGNRLTDAARHGRDHVGGRQHALRDAVEQGRLLDGPVHADDEREWSPLVAPPHEEGVEVEPVDVPERDAMPCFDVTEPTRDVEDRGRIGRARRGDEWEAIHRHAVDGGGRRPVVVDLGHDHRLVALVPEQGQGVAKERLDAPDVGDVAGRGDEDAHVWAPSGRRPPSRCRPNPGGMARG